MKTKLILLIMIGFSLAANARPPRARHAQRVIVADQVALHQDQKELQRAKANHNLRRIHQEKMEIRQDRRTLVRDKRRRRI